MIYVNICTRNVHRKDAAHMLNVARRVHPARSPAYSRTTAFSPDENECDDRRFLAKASRIPSV
jgi:hypothetical protein